MTELLAGVRRRLRLAWGVATAEAVAPVVALVALALVAVGRVRPWSWPEPAALGLAGAAALALVVAVVALRVPMTVAARAADRGLATGDAFFTALELDTRGPVEGPFPDRVRARAARLATGSRAVDAVPVRISGRRLAVVAVLGVAAVGLAVTANSQDDVRRRQAAEREALAAEAAKLRDAADELRRATLPEGTVPEGQEAVARRLEDLARQLAQAPGLDAGRDALDAAARDLASRISSDLLAEKAAVRGLDRSLAATPLPGAGAGDAAAQLRAGAAALAGLTPEARAALADRLAALAATQTAGNPAAASSLAAAAAALRAGDDAAAAAALDAAAGAQDAAAADVGDQEAAMSGLSSIAAAQSNLAAGGAGQGDGQGQGQGTGGPSGQVGGTNASQGSGQGGPGTPDGTGDNASTGLETATVFDPPAEGTPGQQLNTTGQQGEGPTQDAGRVDGPSQRNTAQVPLADVLPHYRAEATRALSQLNIPPSQRALVQSYFASLTEPYGGSPPTGPYGGSPPTGPYGGSPPTGPHGGSPPTGPTGGP